MNVKEIRFGPQTDEHDYNFKLKHAIGFLQDGDKVKAYVFSKDVPSCSRNRAKCCCSVCQRLGRLCKGRADAVARRKENDDIVVSEEGRSSEESSQT